MPQRGAVPGAYNKKGESMGESKKKISEDPNAEARAVNRREWDDIEDEAEEITEEDIENARRNKFSYGNVGSGFHKAVDVGQARKGE